jgi:N-acetyl-D-muramate 6-phosphate phosphatase
LRAIKAILFDLDGTLLDSAPDLVAALNWLRGLEGLAPLDTQVMSRHVSHGANGILTAGMPGTNEAQFAEWKSLFLERYAAVGYCESRLYPGIAAVLSGLRAKQIPWGIVTNKMSALTLPILKSAGLDSEVACVVCGDTLNVNKPHPAPVLHACALLGIQPSDTLFAGDDVRDIQAGRSAGTMTAAVLYGYGSFEFDAALLDQGVTISHPEEFLQLLA